MIESDDPIIQRSGTWTYQDTPNASGGGYLYSTDSVNDVLEFNFTGTTIDIIYIKHPALGRFSIEVDNTIVRTVNGYSEETEFGAIATVDYLDDEPHVLRIFPAEGVIAIDAIYAQIHAVDPMLGVPVDPPDTTPILFYCDDVQNICLDSDDPSYPNPPYVLTTSDMVAPNWSPDGRYVLYGDGAEGVMVGYTGQTWEELWRYQLPNIASIYSLSWTPTNHLVYSDSSANMSCVDLSPVLAALPSFAPPTTCVGVDYLLQIFQIGTQVDLSPDGRYAVYSKPFLGDLYLYDISTATESLLWQVQPMEWFHYPTWSPDSSQIVATRLRTDHRYDLFVIEINPLDGHAVTPPTEGSEFGLRHPSWSPDGTRIVYESRQTIVWDISIPLDLHFSSLKIVSLATGLISDLGPGEGPWWRPVEQLDFCVVQLIADKQYAYRSPSAAHTEHHAALLASPNGEPGYTYGNLNMIAEDGTTPETRDQVFLVGTQLRLGNTYHYTKDIHNSVTDNAVMRILQYNLNPSVPEWITPSDATGDYDLWLYFHPERFTALEGDCSDLEPFEVDDAYLSQIAPRHPAIEELRLFGIEPQDYGIRPTNEDACNSWPYGINCFKPRIWELTEITDVLQAAHDTALAFETVAPFSGSPYEVFNRIMGNFTVVRLENGYVQDGCGSPVDTACTNNNLHTIGFWGYIEENRVPVGFTKELVVHEFGHRFDTRAEGVTGSSLTDYVEETRFDKTLSIRSDPESSDPDGRLVMGSFIDGTTRGPRGWGTGPSSTITLLQQNPSQIPDEIAADMFLNWVYRVVDDSTDGVPRGFRNSHWRSDKSNTEGISCNLVLEGCLDDTHPGDARFNWMDAKMEVIFSEGNSW